MDNLMSVMSVEEAKKACEKIALEYGYEQQSRQLIEEMSELTQAVCKEQRVANTGWPLPDLENLMVARGRILEEIADVQIMLWQITFLLQRLNGAEKNTSEDLARIITRKIRRQFDRIEERRAERELADRADEERKRDESDEQIEPDY